MVIVGLNTYDANFHLARRIFIQEREQSSPIEVFLMKNPAFFVEFLDQLVRAIIMWTQIMNHSSICLKWFPIQILSLKQHSTSQCPTTLLGAGKFCTCVSIEIERPSPPQRLQACRAPLTIEYVKVTCTKQSTKYFGAYFDKPFKKSMLLSRMCRQIYSIKKNVHTWFFLSVRRNPAWNKINIMYEE